MFEVGRICVKLAGRDAGKKAVIIDVNGNYATIDGEVRRRKCNMYHLEPTSKTIDIKKNATHSDIKSEFEKLGLKVFDSKPKQKKTQEKFVPVEKPKAKGKVSKKK